jgi:hypothetical protein
MKSIRPRTTLIVLLIAFIALTPAIISAKEPQPESTKQIKTILAELQDQRDMTEQKLDLAYKSMDDIRKSSGFGELEIREYRHPVEERVIRLTNIVDDLHLDIANIEGRAKQKASKEYDSETKSQLAALASQLQTAQQLLQQAKMDSARLKDARVEYQKHAAVKDDLQRNLEYTNRVIEQYKVKLVETELEKQQNEVNAVEPQNRD